MKSQRTPKSRARSPGSPRAGDFSAARQLKRAGLTLSVALNRYDPQLGNRLIGQQIAALESETNEIETGTSAWRVQWRSAVGTAVRDPIDLEISLVCTRGEFRSASVAVVLEFAGWSAANYVLLPAAAYNGNRFLSRKIPYSPKLHFIQDIGPDKPMIITDVPRLSAGEGVSRIQERSGSLSVPAIGFHQAARKKGFLLFTQQGNSLGDYGIGIEETRRRDRALITITSPVVRELYNYRICDAESPSLDEPHDFKAGDEVTFSLRLQVFSAPRLQDLFDQFARLRKQTAPPSVPKAALPFSACFALQERKFNRDNFVPRHGYYAVGPRQNFLQDWQIGWTGGMISTYALLFAGRRQTRDRVVRNFDWLFPNGIAPSGFFWDSGRNGTEWIGGDIRKPHTGNWHLIRKSGDAVYYIVKQFRLMESLGIAVKPVWRDGLRTVCEAFVRLWESQGQFGQFVDSVTGEIRVGGSTSGAIVPAALALAADYYGDKRYLRVAEAAGKLFYREFTVRGMSCGGPGDALQNPDSESWYALIESYVALYEATGRREWLKFAAETSRQFSTWVVAYDFQFPAGSTFARADIRTTGSVYANTQNKHSAPGLCTFSGLGLLKLFRATGERFHLDLLRDIAFGLPQYLPHPLKPLGDAKPGWMCERVNLTDWEGPDRIGETLKMTTWAETSLMLTTIEIPGLYVQPDASLAVAFDNIRAEIVHDGSKELLLRITNATPAPATIRVFSESARQLKTPLPDNYLLGCRTETLAPGESKPLSFPKS